MILYFGNILSGSGNVPSFIEAFTPKIGELYPVVTASTKENKLLRLLDMMYTLMRFSRQAKIVLIDTYSYQGFYYAWIIGLMSYLLSIPYIPIVHGGDFATRIKRSPRLVSFFLNHAAQIVAPSHYICEILKRNGSTAWFIPNFIPINEYTFKSRTQLLPRFLWVRSFHKIYNPSLAIELVELLKSKMPAVQLIMVGPDKDGCLNFCREMVKSKRLDENVIFTGKLSKQEIRSLADGCDIFINTTNIDNHPVSVIEAMALGLPVVSTDVGGIPHLITANVEGLLVPPGNASAFASAIEVLLSNPELGIRLQTNARTKVEGYDWTIVKEHWIKLLNPYFAA